MCKIFPIALLYLFICISCTDSVPEDFKKEQVSQNDRTDHISILDEIPAHIHKIEKLIIFTGDFEPTHSIELIPEQVFGEDEESNLFWIYEGVEDDNGRLIISGLDSNRGRGAYIYNADGTYYAQLGRQGKGPGEYGTILNISAKAGKVFVSDFTSMRLNEYSTNDYSIERSIKFEQWDIYDTLRFKNFVVPRNDDNYLSAFSEKKPKLGQLEIFFKVMDSEGNNLSDNDLVFPAGFAIDTGSESGISKPSLPLGFMGNTIIAMSKEDDLYVISNNEFLIKKYDANGNYKSAFYYPIVGSPFDLNVYTKSSPFVPKADLIRRAFNNMNEELPKTSPFINDLIVDDEKRIWVAIPANDKNESYDWFILKESGELIAKLLLPRNQRIFDIKKGYLYARKDNGKKPGYLYSGDGSDPADAEHIVKYRIQFIEK